ncbi:uncharacterized protein C9orf85 homolog isoform X2 [Acanthaster planci]|uniref:Uncharacterized protein C9orf85 homolog isoform X2 n=1 Tax=Acanthaster planci TaxID=133434 RepID=A0A8B7YSJ6_ACAPL|nr:uncharacterized protein C9orf85 homolog isoform X2 [Acanthaster planci]
MFFQMDQISFDKWGRYSTWTVLSSLTSGHFSVKCEQKAVTQAYHIMCKPCATAAKVCAKCGKNDIVTEQGMTPAEEAPPASQLQTDLRQLTEKQRQSFFHYQAKGCPDEGDGSTPKEAQCMSKSQELDDDDGDDGFDDYDESRELDEAEEELNDRTCST